MPGVVEHLEALTGSRDRELLEVTLVSAFRDLLHPISVGIYRRVGEGDDARWMSRARIGPADRVAAADPPWTEFDELPSSADHPHRERVMSDGKPAFVAGETHLSALPLASDHDVLGVLEIETAAPLDAPSLQLVTSVLRIHRNFLALLDYSERDTLTGLLNRKTFDESFIRLTGATTSDEPDGRRGGGTFAHFLAVIDIDHFKRVNDNFGHLIGDEVLLLLARLMRGCFRVDDRLYRFGGEEFVVTMRCPNAGGALNAFERLRSAVENYLFPQVGHITVSIGLTEIHPDDVPTGAFARADKATYYAKAHGRNQVCDHADLVARGELVDESKVGGVEMF